MPRAFSLVAIIAFTAVIGCLWSLHQLRVERGRVVALQTRIAQLETKHASVASQTGHVNAPKTRGPHGVESSATPNPAQQDRAEPPVFRFARRERELLGNPGYREAMRRQRRVHLALGHVDLAPVLGIPQKTADALIDLLVDEELRYLSEAHPNPINEEEMSVRRRQISEAQRLLDAKLVALLGEERLSKWKDYQAGLTTRHFVYQLRASLSGSAEPLSDYQVEPLIASIHAEQEQREQALREYSANLSWTAPDRRQSDMQVHRRRAELTSDTNQRIHAAAAAILFPTQLARLDDALRRQLELQSAQRDMQAAELEASANRNVVKAE